MLSVPSPYLAPVSPSSEYDPEADPLELWADTPSAGMRAIAGIASAVGAPSSTPAGSPRMSPSPIGSASSRTGRGESQLSSLGMMRSQSKFRPGANPRHSLLGAIEFRDVVRSLRAESNYTDADDRSLEVFQSRDPESFTHTIITILIIIINLRILKRDQGINVLKLTLIGESQV